MSQICVHLITVITSNKKNKCTTTILLFCYVSFSDDRNTVIKVWYLFIRFQATVLVPSHCTLILTPDSTIVPFYPITSPRWRASLLFATTIDTPPQPPPQFVLPTPPSVSRTIVFNAQWIIHACDETAEKITWSAANIN